MRNTKIIFQLNVKAKGHFPQISSPSEIIDAIDLFLEKD